MPQLFIGSTVPNFSFGSQIGCLEFYDYVGSGWAIIFSHPSDFTPVCTTELGEVRATKTRSGGGGDEARSDRNDRVKT